MAVDVQRVTTETEPERSAEAGAAQFPGWNSRRFTYYQPLGKRDLRQYQDVTVDVQPDPSRYLLQSWIISFADGTPSYHERWTALKSGDWHQFRDPNGEWERTIYMRESTLEKHVALTTSNARSVGVFERFDPSWAKVLERHVLASKHPEYWLGMEVFLQAQRDAVTNMINNAIAVNAMDKLRYAQDLALYGMDLAESVTGFSEDASRQTWLEDPIWQPSRENVELLSTTSDWGEQVFATNFVYEPLVGELFRSNFIMQFAAIHGDFVTPVITGAAEWDYERHLQSSQVLFGMLIDDPTFGDHNRQVMQGWLKTWVPRSAAAAKQLQPIWSQPRVKQMTFTDAYERAKARLHSILGELRMELPAGVEL
jgi:propane monooxygenase small subunit